LTASALAHADVFQKNENKNKTTSVYRVEPKIDSIDTLNIYFRLSGFQSSFLLIYFR